MAKTNVEITIEPDSADLQNSNWTITFNGENWEEPEVIKGGFDADCQTVIETPDIFDSKRNLVYNLVNYACGDM